MTSLAVRLQFEIVLLIMNSSMCCPPIAVSATAMGMSTPSSARPCAKYQHAPPMSKTGQLPFSTQPSGAACAAVIQALDPLTPPYGTGQKPLASRATSPRGCVPELPVMRRRLLYLPALMLRAVSLRQYVWSTGSHMLDWPVQYQKSPKATFEIEAVDGKAARQPSQLAVMVKLPPAGIGGRSAFHDASGEKKGLKGLLMSGHDAHGRTPQSGPNVCAVALSAATTVVGAPLSGVSVTRTTAPAIDAP